MINLFYSGLLGSKYSKTQTEFGFWAPDADSVSIYLYEEDRLYKMDRCNNGAWILSIKGDLKNKFYNYIVKYGINVNTVVDPYAYAVSVNGIMSMVVDLSETNPEGWSYDTKPEFKKAKDAIIYEMHVRDFTIENENVPKKFKGKFKGLTYDKVINHLVELGITHVHLLPIADYKSIDEENLNDKQYNWGYDPQNYNVPEGSYSTNAYDGKARIKEFKEVVMAMHKAGLRVVMDVVYNHTYDIEDSLFNKAVPKYYHRTDENGNFTNGSACGNEIASEKPMVRRFIKDSLIHWVKEYHIDGFRFDLMGLHDIETMIQIREELDKIDPSIIMYGEGWKGGPSALSEELSALKMNTSKFGEKQIACFSDDIRDGVKGDVFKAKSKGFVNGGEGFEETIKAGIVASTNHNQVDYSKVLYTNKPWANEPYQTVNYASAHDNYTLWDKLQLTLEDTNLNKEEELIKMNKLVASIILTSQGITFMHSGEEILRTKVRPDGGLEENSYNSPDSVNKFDWNRKEKYKDVFNYYSGLIRLRKTYDEFRLTSSKEIKEKIKFINNDKKKIVVFEIDEKIVVIHNAREKAINISLPEGKWSIVVNENQSGIEELSEVTNNVIVPRISSYVLIKKEIEYVKL